MTYWSVASSQVSSLFDIDLVRKGGVSKKDSQKKELVAISSVFRDDFATIFQTQGLDENIYNQNW